VKVSKKEARNSSTEIEALPKAHDGEDEKWLESLESVLEFALKNQGPQKTSRFLDSLMERLRDQGVESPRVVSTPYLNTIPPEKQAPFPGEREMERWSKA